MNSDNVKSSVDRLNDNNSKYLNANVNKNYAYQSPKAALNIMRS
jgi:hypothetical protein